MITCQLCNKQFNQITGSHLKKVHSTNLKLYKMQFPNASIVSEECSQKISNASKRPRSAEHQEALTKSIRKTFENGRTPPHKGMKGAWRKDSEETIARKKASAQKRPNPTQETKDKIGRAHKGKKRSKEEIENWKVSYTKFLEENGGSPQKGRKRSDEFKERMSEIAKNRNNELVDSKVQMMLEARRGQVMTDEQKERYRTGMLRYIENNPKAIKRKWKDTRPEIQFREYLESININYVFQYHSKNPHFLFDFYLPDHNTVVEIDGPHHYNPKVHNSLENFQKQQARDNKKTNGAVQLGLNLVRIKVTNDLPKDFLEICLAQKLDLKR